MGADQYAKLDTWHRPEDVKRLAQIAVFARPGRCSSRGMSRSIPMEPLPISASEIRARVARGEDIAGAGAAGGGELHRAPQALRLMDIRVKQRAVVEALEDVKGHDIVVFNTARLPSMFERVVIASGDSNRQVKALADHVQERMRELGARVYGVEGESSGEWVLVDLGDIVVHVMHPTVREFYNLEEIWGGKEVRLKKVRGQEGGEEARQEGKTACQDCTSSP